MNEESYDLKHNVVKEKLEEVVKNLILKSIQIEEKLDLDILSREAPEKISRILKDENSSPNKKRLAIKALWILSADFPGNSKINFLKSLTSFGYDGEIESFEDLSDDDVRKSLDYCFDKFPEMIKNIEFKDVWGFLREISDSQNSIVRSADFGVNFYDMVQERLKILPFAESFGDEYLDFYRSSNDGGRTILLPALGELSSDEIFYHPKRSEILDLLKCNTYHLPRGNDSNLNNSNILAHNVWNEIFLKAVEKQDVVFLEEVLVMGADINIDFSQSISEAFKISVKTQNKDLFRTFIADPNVSESLRYALLFAAIKNGLDQFSEIILEHSIGDINRTDLAEDDDLLYCAIYYGRTKIAVQLLEKGARIKKEGGVDNSAKLLALAIENQDLNSFKLLMEYGATKDADLGSGNNIFHLAAAINSNDILEYLLNEPDMAEYLGKDNNLGNSVLSMAIDNNYVESAKLIFEKLTPNQQIQFLINISFEEKEDLGNALLVILEDKIEISKDKYFPPSAVLVRGSSPLIYSAEKEKEDSEPTLINALKRHEKFPKAQAILKKIQPLKEEHNQLGN
ncbi:MAG: ankyrin repeat protein [Rickettsiales bacterium]